MTGSDLYFFKLFFFKVFFFFDVDHFEVFTEFVTVLLLMFMFWCFDHAACGFYLPRD